MIKLGILYFLFGKKDAAAARPSRTRTVLNLQVNDVVTYDLEDYIVAGKIVYNDSGYTWTAYNLKGDAKYIWLAAELDDELELGIYERVVAPVPDQIGEELTVDGTTYYLEEQSSARITEVQGQAGARVGQQVAYWDFESEEGTYLSIERWGGDLEISKGYAIKESELKIIAGS